MSDLLLSYGRPHAEWATVYLLYDLYVTCGVDDNFGDAFVIFDETGDADCLFVVLDHWVKGEVVSVVAPDHDGEPAGIWVGLADV